MHSEAIAIPPQPTNVRLEPTQTNVINFPSVATDAHARHILRSSLTAAIAELVDLLDRLDGDPDAEQTGDEGEPDFLSRYAGRGPGCPISDPGEPEEGL